MRGDEVFDAVGDAVQRAAVAPALDLGLGLAGLPERRLARDGGDGVQALADRLKPSQVGLGQLDGRDAARANLRGEFADGREECVVCNHSASQ